MSTVKGACELLVESMVDSEAQRSGKDETKTCMQMTSCRKELRSIVKKTVQLETPEG